MDPLDLILLEAWNRISKKVREQRIEALRRSQRRFKGVLTRPMREWCLVIRASDTRINKDNGAVFDEAAVANHDAHQVIVPGFLIRRLTKPIVIPWPGVTYEEAARICGREYSTLKSWVHNGNFRIDRYREFKFPEHGKRGKGGGRPYVWTPSPIDPNNFQGRAPHPVWGTLWQSLWEKLPEEYELEVRREPVIRTIGGKTAPHGWDFVCPGRMNQDGTYQGCGRRCRYLYGPQTIWTLGKAIGLGDDGFEMPDDSGLRGEWFPGLSDTVAAEGTRSFACKTCWRVRSACMANDNGWNEFIAQISGGLLYGRDVPRPADICPIARKKRPYQWKKPHPCKKRVDPAAKPGEMVAVSAQAG